jgi:hypothetical protein
VVRHHTLGNYGEADLSPVRSWVLDRVGHQPTSWARAFANFGELRYGEVRAGVKVCIAPPRQDPDCASEVCPYSAPSIVCVRVHQADRSGR